MSGAGDAKKSFAVLGAAGNVLALKDHFEDALFSARTVHGSRVAWVVHLPDEALLATHPRAPGRRPTSRVELVAEVEAAPLDLLAKIGPEAAALGLELDDQEATADG